MGREVEMREAARSQERKRLHGIDTCEALDAYHCLRREVEATSSSNAFFVGVTMPCVLVALMVLALIAATALLGEGAYDRLSGLAGRHSPSAVEDLAQGRRTTGDDDVTVAWWFGLE